VVLLFQHNNLKATEFMALRRELAQALRKVDEEQAKVGDVSYVGSEAKIQVVQTGILAAALKVVEFWDPNFDADASAQPATQAAPGSSQSLVQEKVVEHKLTHGLSRDAWLAAWRRNKTAKHGLEPLLSGPIALFTLPTVSTAHLRAALSILAPSPAFPAPKRKANAGYYEAPVQNALQKLMLLGARVEGKAFDSEGVQWVGSIQGGLDGLRAQLVAALQGIGAGVTTTLESAGRSLYFTVEGRRIMLEEEGKETTETK
jgi:large subunit ribosomal protein L10